MPVHRLPDCESPTRNTFTHPLTRPSVKPDGIEIAVGKRKPGQAQRAKIFLWSQELKATIDEALSLLRTKEIYIFSNTAGQVYSRSGFTTILNHLMKYCEDEASKEGTEFKRFTLANMRPTAVTDRVEGGDKSITDATGHTDERMVKRIYDRRKIRKDFVACKKITPKFRSKRPKIFQNIPKIAKHSCGLQP